MKKLIALLVGLLFALTLMVAACAKKEDPTKPATGPAKKEAPKKKEPSKKQEKPS